MIRRLSILWLFLAASAPAGAQTDPPAQADAQSARVESLAARAIAAIEAFPAEKRPRSSELAQALLVLRRCSLAERVLLGNPVAARAALPTPYPEVLDGDPACGDRLITLAAKALTPGKTEPEAWDLYTNGALWRRLGKVEKAEQAIAEAERLLAEQEARDPDGAWSCHGGNCLSGLWQTRLWALGLTRGSAYHVEDLRRAGGLALSHHHAREANRPGPYIGQEVFERLLPMTVDAGDDRLAQRVAGPTVYGNRAYPAQRMRRLLEQGRVAEALELWPAAGEAFGAPIAPALFRAHLPLFHARREQLRARPWRGPGELLSLLAAAWVERGDPARAREALATARAHHAAVKGLNWELQHVQRLLAVEAMLEGGGDPVGWLRRRNLSAGGPEHDHAFGELAALLAATDRQPETRRALAAIRDPRIRRSVLVELPCRAARGGDSTAAFAVSLARGHLRPGSRTEEKERGFDHVAFQTFVCLVAARRGEAATAYAQAIEDPDARLSLLTQMPFDSGIADEAALRRRLANLAFALVEARNLWADGKVAYMAADLERTGQFEKADRVLARVRGRELRMEVYERLLRAHAPSRYR